MSQIRIIGGEFRGRRLLSPPEEAETRPMPSRVRESLFGHFRGHTQDAMIFDAFSGTGSFGLEAISRGASKVVFVEKDKAMARVLKQNAENLGVLDRIEIFEGDALGAGALSRCPRPVTLALLDPPYPLARDPLGWQRIKLQAEKLVQCLNDDGYLILRVPHPFFFDQVDDEQAAPKRKKEKRKGKRWSIRELEREEREKSRSKKIPSPINLGDEDGDEANNGEIIELDLASMTDEEIDALDARDAAAAEVAITANAEKGRGQVSVTLDGALGPETHLYGTMAVHLYMRDRSIS